MPDIQKYLGNVSVVSGRLTAPKENEPGQYSNRGYPYLNTASTRFYEEYAKYASDYFVNVEAQGLNPENAYEWETVTMRVADLVKTSAAMQRQFDNHKMVLLDKMKYAYVPRGAKFVLMGSVWLCTNPENISGSDGIGVIQRCNTTWNHLDWYGNVVKEPIVFETEILRANAPDPQYNMNIVKGYFNIKCQYNQDTAQINDNTRMILGSSCYVVSGYSDFEQEFTENYDSVRLLQFSVRRDEVNKTIDDLANRVAGGLVFKWDISITGSSTVPIGSSTTLTASSLRCGEEVGESEENPVTYSWASSDTGIATVDTNGTVTGISEGACVITATLEQNPSFSETFSIEVTEEQENVAWETTPPELLTAYHNVTLTAVTPNEGETVTWSFSGADENAYSYVINGNSCTITCWGGSIEPLTVTATAGGMSETNAVVGSAVVGTSETGDDGSSNVSTVTAVIPLNGI